MSQNQNLNTLIGKIVSGFVKTEFLMSDIAHRMGFEKSPYHFFGNTRTREKLHELKRNFINSDFHRKQELVECMDEIDELRNLRNHMVHSLILTNSTNTEFMSYKYRLSKSTIEREFGHFTLNDLEDLVNRITDAHNSLYKIYFNSE